LGNNVYVNSSGAQAYIVTDEASVYRQVGGEHYFQVASSGTADAAISFTTAMIVKNGGNVGIGTATPAMTLDVAGTTKQQSYTAYYHDDHSTLAGYVGDASAISSLSDDDLFIRSNKDFGIGTNNTGASVRFFINTTGNVGIGTTTPSQKLEVAGTALINNGSNNHHLYFGNTSYGIHVVHSTGVMNFVSNSSTRMSIANGGDVSITGNLLPTADNSSDLGSSSKRWANIYSADLHLSNEDTGGNEIDGTEGNWTIQEGEDDLYLLNNKNGKKYKFVLQEIE